MALIFDTHALIWFGSADSRFSTPVRAVMEAPDTRLFVSAVTAWEYADLRNRGRIPTAADFARLGEMMDFELLDFPADLWAFAARLPRIHRDPVDRMTIAHAIALDLTLVSADKTMARYPVKTLW